MINRYKLNGFKIQNNINSKEKIDIYRKKRRGDKN